MALSVGLWRSARVGKLRMLGRRPLAAVAGAVPGTASDHTDDDADRCLQLYIFEAPPRAMVRLAPVAEEVLLDSSFSDSVGGSSGSAWGVADPKPSTLPLEELIRAVHRAAQHPWRDARFWRRAAEQLAAREPVDVQGRDLAQVCAAFRRIRFTSPVLVQYCQRYVLERRQALNTFQLASVAAYCVSTCSIPRSSKVNFAQVVADEVCVDWRKREIVPWPAWRTLVSTVAEVGVPHQALFAIASPQLARNVCHMNGRDAAEVCAAYAALRFKHNGLLEELSRFTPSMGLSDSEVASLQSSFARLEYEAPLLSRISELRSGYDVGGQTYDY